VTKSTLMKFCLKLKDAYVKNTLKMVINNTTIGTQKMVVHVTESAVAFLSIPYGTRNMLVLVIGRIEFITTTANHSLGMRFRTRNILKKRAVSKGVTIAVRKKMLLTPDQ